MDLKNMCAFSHKTTDKSVYPSKCVKFIYYDFY